MSGRAELDSLQAGAVAACRAAGEVLLRRFGSIPPAAVQEKGRHDYVTQADREAEEAALAVLEERFPGAAVLAEESGGPQRREGLRWVVDPLDGTTNYVHGYPLFAVSVSCEMDGTPAVGAVLDPLRGELFQAMRGAGATLGDERISVSERRVLGRALLVSGHPFREQDRMDSYVAGFADFLRRASAVRRDGSASLDLCYVACGRYDGFWEMGLGRWDLSAGAIIVREAGGVVTGFGAGEDPLETGNVVASNSRIHEAMLEVLRAHPW